MSVFHHEELEPLNDPSLVIAVAQAIHEQAKSLQAQDKISSYFFDREIYEYGEEKTLPNGDSYREVSSYSDGFGASIFVRDGEMLMLGSNHELAPMDAIDGDRDLYLSPLLKGLPPKWDFVVNMLQTEERFRLNPPISVFWFTNGEWHVTDLYEQIKNADFGSRLWEYRDIVDYVPSGEFHAIFEHGGLTEVDEKLVYDTQLRGWVENY